VLNVAQLRIASTGARVRITPTQPNYDQQLDQSVNRLKKTKNPVAAAALNGLDMVDAVTPADSPPEKAQDLVVAYNAYVQLRDAAHATKPFSSTQLDAQLDVLAAMQTALLSKGHSFSLELISAEKSPAPTQPAPASEVARAPESGTKKQRVLSVEVPYANNQKMVALHTSSGVPIPIFPDQFTGCKFVADPQNSGRGMVEIIPDGLNYFPYQTQFDISETDWRRIEALVPRKLIVNDEKVKILDNDKVELNGWQFRIGRLKEPQLDTRALGRLVVTAPSVEANPRQFRIEISEATWQRISKPVNSGRLPEKPEAIAKSVGVGSWADQGRRAYMEDRTLVANDVLASGDSLVGIFDGHGGDAVAQMAQEQMVSIMKQLARSERDVNEILRKSILTLNSIIEQDPKLKNVGATAAMIYVRDGVLYSANVGDARSVIDGAGGMAVRVSKDHKADDAEEEARIRRDGGFVTRGMGGDVARVNGVLAVARALGDRSMGPAISAEAYLTETKLGADNTIAIVACDGIWDVISDEEAMQLAKNMRSQGKNEQEIARALVQKAFDLNSGDNLSATVVFLK
nr:protein serine/threonine phosphatase 2C family protein [Candidatus Woesebacteria bacterium]